MKGKLRRWAKKKNQSIWIFNDLSCCRVCFHRHRRTTNFTLWIENKIFFQVDPKDDDTSIDCIDLENDHEYESVTTFRSASPTISIRTEFTDPDLYGKSKQKGIQNDNNGAIIGTIQSMVGSVIGSGAGQTNQTRRPKSTYPRIEENEEDAKGSKKGNKMSCEKHSCTDFLFFCKALKILCKVAYLSLIFVQSYKRLLDSNQNVAYVFH